MKFALSKEHRDFFQKQGLIEFENFFSEAQIDELKEGIEKALSERLKNKNKLEDLNRDKLFFSGRDLFRYSDKVKKGVVQKNITSIAAELNNETLLRIGFDQYFPTIPSLFDEVTPYLNFLREKNLTLSEITSIQGTSIGVMIALQDHDLNNPLFPKQKGNVVFFSTVVPIDFSSLIQKDFLNYFMIVFTKKTAVYVGHQKDPLVSSLRGLGYQLGDALNDKTNPIIYRS